MPDWTAADATSAPGRSAILDDTRATFYDRDDPMGWIEGHRVENSPFWRTAHEVMKEVRSADGRVDLRHEFALTGPWNWTCRGCGFSVRPTGLLDNALSRTQGGGAAAWLAGLLGRGPQTDGSAVGPRPTHLALAAGGAAVILFALVVAAQPQSPVPTATAGPTPGPAAASTPARMVQVGEIISADPDAVAGRQVELRSMTVTKVTGDTTFWIEQGGVRALIAIDETIQPERAVTIEAGQVVSVRGTVNRGRQAGAALSSADRAEIDSVEVYVLARRVDIESP